MTQPKRKRRQIVEEWDGAAYFKLSSLRACCKHLWMPIIAWDGAHFHCWQERGTVDSISSFIVNCVHFGLIHLFMCLLLGPVCYIAWYIGIVSHGSASRIFRKCVFGRWLSWHIKAIHKTSLSLRALCSRRDLASRDSIFLWATLPLNASIDLVDS